MESMKWERVNGATQCASNPLTARIWGVTHIRYRVVGLVLSDTEHESATVKICRTISEAKQLAQKLEDAIEDVK